MCGSLQEVAVDTEDFLHCVGLFERLPPESDVGSER